MESNSYNKFLKEFRRIRKSQGRTLEWVSRHSGMSASLLSHMERGELPLTRKYLAVKLLSCIKVDDNTRSKMLAQANQDYMINSRRKWMKEENE